MAQQALLQRVLGLVGGKLTGVDSGTNDRVRDNINKRITEAVVSKKTITDSLVLAFEKYAPEAANNNNKKKEFAAFAGALVNAWKAEVTKSSYKEIVDVKSSNSGELIFNITPRKGAANAEKWFSELNTSLCEPLMTGPKYGHLFQESVQEQGSGTGQFEGTNALSKLQMAHADKQSVYDMKTSIRADKILGEDDSEGIAGGIDLEKLDPEAYKIVTAFQKDFTSGLSADATRSFTIDNKGNIKSIEIVTLGVESTAKNIEDASSSMSKGRAQNKLLRDLQKDILAHIENNPAEFGSDAHGSGSVTEGVGDTIVNSMFMKKMYSKKNALNLTKFKGLTKSSTTTAKGVKGPKVKTKTKRIVGNGPTSKMKGLPPKSQTPEKGTGSGFEEQGYRAEMLLALRGIMNKALPARIKQNMTGSALKNRSGRFAESVRVDQVSPAAKTLVIKYTYRLNPYETFENTGKRKWPTGYNPKTLIAKSIRQLALELMGIKMITTRRV